MVEVDLLVGSDYYFDIVHPERVELSGGLRLLGSSLGYLLAGSLDCDSRYAVQLFSSSRLDTSLDCATASSQNSKAQIACQRSLQNRCVPQPVCGEFGDDRVVAVLPSKPNFVDPGGQLVSSPPQTGMRVGSD